MKRKSQDYTDYIASNCPYKAADLDELAAVIGFRSCLYCARIFPPLATPMALRLDNYSNESRGTGEADQMQEYDQLISRACENSAPFSWSNDSPSCTEVRQHGLRYGFTIPLWNLPGAVGMLTFSRPETAVSAAELKAAVKQVVLPGYEMHLSMTRWCKESQRPHEKLRVSERERVILKWIADGKTSAEVASILGVKPRTINFHVSNAMKKLNATNKTQAAVKATCLGLLY